MTSIRPAERLSLHISEAKKGISAKNSKKNTWLRALLADGLEPSMRVLYGYDTREDARGIEELLLAHLDGCREMVNTYPFHKANRAA